MKQIQHDELWETTNFGSFEHIELAIPFVIPSTPNDSNSLMKFSPKWSSVRLDNANDVWLHTKLQGEYVAPILKSTCLKCKGFFSFQQLKFNIKMYVVCNTTRGLQQSKSRVFQSRRTMKLTRQKQKKNKTKNVQQDNTFNSSTSAMTVPAK